MTRNNVIKPFKLRLVFRFLAFGVYCLSSCFCCLTMTAMPAVCLILVVLVMDCYGHKADSASYTLKIGMYICYRVLHPDIDRIKK